jgi:hypothetical protein
VASCNNNVDILLKMSACKNKNLLEKKFQDIIQYKAIKNRGKVVQSYREIQ